MTFDDEDVDVENDKWESLDICMTRNKLVPCYLTVIDMKFDDEGEEEEEVDNLIRRMITTLMSDGDDTGLLDQDLVV